MSRKLLIATRNKGKFPEIMYSLNGLDFDFINLNDCSEIDISFEVEEPAMTFEGNAIIKAMTIGNISKCLTIAEDAGLEVHALGGRPGVFSARYVSGSDEDRYMKLLQEMKDIPKEERTANFVAVVAIYDPESRKIRTCRADYEGVIAFEPIGDNGFGYDPIFYCPDFKKTYAQLSKEEKDIISHRGQAFKKAKEILMEEYVE